jgi:HK97 family phage prohead protease
VELAEKFFDAYDEVPNHRSARLAEIEVSEWSEGFRFEGLAAVFGKPTEVGGQFYESVEHGAFRKALSSGENVPMFVEHALKSDQIPLATTAGGTMRLREVPEGLKVEADVADTTLGRDLRISVKRGDISGMSYGFIAGKGAAKWTRKEGRTHRVLHNLKKILDVSPTWDPEYQHTSAEFRTAQLAIGSPESLQQILSGDLSQLEEGAVVEELDPPSGVSTSLAARKRHLQLMALTLEGGDYE